MKVVTAHIAVVGQDIDCWVKVDYGIHAAVAVVAEDVVEVAAQIHISDYFASVAHADCVHRRIVEVVDTEEPGDPGHPWTLQEMEAVVEGEVQCSFYLVVLDVLVEIGLHAV